MENLHDLPNKLRLFKNFSFTLVQCGVTSICGGILRTFNINEIDICRLLFVVLAQSTEGDKKTA